jgi:hypothetical protein
MWCFPGYSSLLVSESQPGLVVQRGRLPLPVTLAQGGSAVKSGPCTTPRTMTNTDRQARALCQFLPLESLATPERGLNGPHWKPPRNILHDAPNSDASHGPPVPADDKIHTRKIERSRDFRWESITREACTAELLRSVLVSLPLMLSCFLKQASGGNTARQQTTYGRIRRPRDKGLTSPVSHFDQVRQAVNYLIAIRSTTCQQSMDRCSNPRLYCRQGAYSKRLILNTWRKTSFANGIAITKRQGFFHSS